MNLIGVLLTLISFLPFWVLHRFSDLTYFGIFHLLGYRRKVVWQNLRNSFPEKTDQEILLIQKKFYQNFCDLIFETIKTFSISEKEIQSRCKLENPELFERLFQEGKSLVGVSSHMGNWEWMSLSFSLASKFQIYAVYKPLANQNLSRVVVSSRERFGARFVAIKELKSVLDQHAGKPFIVGLLSDQAPHDYSKSFEFPFLNQSTFFVPGPGILSVKRGLAPIYGWTRRVGRSRYVWHVESLEDPTLSMQDLNQQEQEQVQKISKAHDLNEEDSVRALQITRKFVRQLEEEIKMAPQDWLWSHRRWKTR